MAVKFYGDELSEMTVGIIGYGHVGTRVVRLLKAFGCRILVCDPYVLLAVEDLRDGVEQVSLDRLLARSDVVSLHPRVTEETRGMIGAAQFAAMKPGSVFINTARGPLVDYQALNDALASNHLRGAAIETFAVSPLHRIGRCCSCQMSRRPRTSRGPPSKPSESRPGQRPRKCGDI
jgi:D-3-phosphoglycerate dehydrogenase / 2-oxoglutarate reductase